MDFASINPFAYREARSRRELASYRVLTLASWALAMALSVYFSVCGPDNGNGRRIADQNRAHPTGFTLNMEIVYIYWILLFLNQAAYVNRLFSSSIDTAVAAAAVGSHFITHNVLHAAFVLFFVSGHFVWAEIALVVNFVNLTALSVLHPLASHPLALVHEPTVSGPLAWTYVALFWNGAMAVPHAHGEVARVLANVFVWSFLGYGLLFVLLGDVSMGLNLSILTAALGVGQFFVQAIALQWIFAFVIMAVLFLATCAFAVPQWIGVGEGAVLAAAAVEDAENAERSPLLDE